MRVGFDGVTRDLLGADEIAFSESIVRGLTSQITG